MRCNNLAYPLLMYVLTLIQPLDVKEIELIVQQPDAELNGDGEGDNRDSVIIRETKTIKGGK